MVHRLIIAAVVVLVAAACCVVQAVESDPVLALWASVYRGDHETRTDTKAAIIELGRDEALRGAVPFLRVANHAVSSMASDVVMHFATVEDVPLLLGEVARAQNDSSETGALYVLERLIRRAPDALRVPPAPNTEDPDRTSILNHLLVRESTERMWPLEYRSISTVRTCGVDDERVYFLGDRAVDLVLDPSTEPDVPADTGWWTHARVQFRILDLDPEAEGLDVWSSLRVAPPMAVAVVSVGYHIKGGEARGRNGIWVKYGGFWYPLGTSSGWYAG